MIGIADFSKQRELKICLTIKTAMSYSGHDCKIRPYGIFQGTGFQQGDIVEVHVDRPNSTVRFIVSGQEQTIQSYNNLLDS